MPDVLPGVASSLLVQGMVLSHTNLSGEGEPWLHPSVKEFFSGLPVRLREPFLGYCAESALVSDQLRGLDARRTDGRVTTLDEAVEHFAGSAITSKLIREPGDPDHGRPTRPCRSCAALLDRLGVRTIGA